MRQMWQTQQFPFAFGVFKAPRVTWDEHTGQGDAYFTWVYGCQAVELTVNKKTGKVKLLNAVAAHDVGRAVNPEMVRGQFYGGMAMSAGYALHEEVKAPGRQDHHAQPQHLSHPARDGFAGDEGDHHRESRPAVADRREEHRRTGE